jgi:flagellar biosynthesis regulator FlbT
VERAQVFDLLIEIKENYPNFDVSAESVERHLKHLHDFPFGVAMQNVDEHVKTGKYYPNIAEIRGSLGEQVEGERMKASFHQSGYLELSKQAAARRLLGIHQAEAAR